MTSTFQLTARLDHPQLSTAYTGCYSYYEEALGIVAEPLVYSTTAVIQHCFGAPHPDDRTSTTDKHSPSCVVLSFSTERTQLPATTDALVELRLTASDDDGSDYGVRVLHSHRNPSATQAGRPLTAWLCRHLGDYFDEPPALFFCALQQTDAR